jgi:hypothetical protein
MDAPEERKKTPDFFSPENMSDHLASAQIFFPSVLSETISRSCLRLRNLRLLNLSLLNFVPFLRITDGQKLSHSFLTAALSYFNWAAEEPCRGTGALEKKSAKMNTGKKMGMKKIVARAWMWTRDLLDLVDFVISHRLTDEPKQSSLPYTKRQECNFDNNKNVFNVLFKVFSCVIW